MKEIRITENLSEMVEIGRQIFEERKEWYSNEKRLRSITDVIDLHMPDATDKEKEDVFFRSLYHYWVYGNNIKEEFYFNFAEKTHAQKQEYITYRNRFLYMKHLNSVENRHYLDNKWEAYELMKPYYRREAILIKQADDYDAFAEFVQKHPDFVVKPVGMSAGRGVHKESCRGVAAKELFDKILQERNALAEKYHYGDSSAMMLEEIVDQDERMAALHPASLQSIRLVTVRVGDKVNIWYPRIDIGRGGSFLINAAAGSIMALVDPKTGVIKGKGIPESGELFEVHPDTGVRIEGFQIPEWDALIEMATDLMLNVMPDIRYVGWDMALSKKGWCVVEGNWAGEFVGDQLGQGHGLRREFEEMIGWKPAQTYWWEE